MGAIIGMGKMDIHHVPVVGHDVPVAGHDGFFFGDNFLCLCGVYVVGTCDFGEVDFGSVFLHGRVVITVICI